MRLYVYDVAKTCEMLAESMGFVEAPGQLSDKKRALLLLTTDWTGCVIGGSDDGRGNVCRGHWIRLLCTIIRGSPMHRPGSSIVGNFRACRLVSGRSGGTRLVGVIVRRDRNDILVVHCARARSE